MRTIRKGIRWRWPEWACLAAFLPCLAHAISKPYPDSRESHDFQLIGFDYTEGSSYRLMRCELFGMGYGNRLVDVYSGFNLGGMRGRHPADTNGYFGISTFASLFSILSGGILGIDKVRAWIGDDAATAIVLAPFIFHPEVRFFPASPAYPYLGWNLDMGFDGYSGQKDRFRYLYGLRGGLNADLYILRLKMGYSVSGVDKRFNHGVQMGVGFLIPPRLMGM